MQISWLPVSRMSIKSVFFEDFSGKDSFRSGTNYPDAICSQIENVTADSMVQTESAATAKSSSPFISFAIT